MTDIRCDSNVCVHKKQDGYCGKSRIELGLGWCQDEEYEQEDNEDEVINGIRYNSEDI
jgi:hypothetical protein